MRDAVISVGGGLKEMHKLTCSGCRAIGTFERSVATGKQQKRSAEGQFRWIQEDRNESG